MIAAARYHGNWYGLAHLVVELQVGQSGAGVMQNLAMGDGHP